MQLIHRKSLNINKTYVFKLSLPSLTLCILLLSISELHNVLRLIFITKASSRLWEGFRSLKKVFCFQWFCLVWLLPFGSVKATSLVWWAVACFNV